MDLSGALDILIPIFFILYGISIKRKPPVFGTKNSIISTKLSRQSPATWNYAQSLASTLCIVYGVMLLAFIIIKISLIDYGVSLFWDIFPLFLYWAFVLSLFPIVNISIKNKFGSNIGKNKKKNGNGKNGKKKK